MVSRLLRIKLFFFFIIGLVTFYDKTIYHMKSTYIRRTSYMYLIQKLNLKLPSAMLLQSYFIQLFLKHVQYFTISLVSIYDSWALNNTAESVLLMWYWIAHLSLYDSPESLWLMRKFCSHETELLTWAYMIFWASFDSWVNIDHVIQNCSPEPIWLC